MVLVPMPASLVITGNCDVLVGAENNDDCVDVIGDADVAADEFNENGLSEVLELFLTATSCPALKAFLF